MTTEPTRMNWIGIDPAEWLRNWQAVWRLAPDTLNQPILPGWTFNVNSNNSTSPQTAVDVLARHSYGRQLGRLSDAVEKLIVQAHGEQPRLPAFAEFLQMKRDIDEVKNKAAARRVTHFGKDLQALKRANPTEFDQVRAALRKLLAD